MHPRTDNRKLGQTTLTEFPRAKSYLWANMPTTPHRPYSVQGHPVNVKHDARCVMGKVRGRQKLKGDFNLLYINTPWLIAFDNNDLNDSK